MQVPPPPSIAPGPEVIKIKAVKPKASTTSQKFDPNKLQLTVKDRHWSLTEDGKTVKDFGLNERDARLALRIIQQLGLDEVGRVGPSVGMEYWLAQGHAPMAPLRAGLRTVQLDPAALRVARVQGQWCVRDERRVISAFGTSEADAQKSLELIKQYRFNQAALLGQTVPSMTVYFGQQSKEVPVLKINRTAADSASPGSMSSPHFPRLAKNKDGTPKMTAPTGPNPGLEGASPPLIAPPTAAAPKEKRPFWHSRTSLGEQKPASADGRTVFDWRRVEMRVDGGQTDLASGGQVLAHFRGNADDARTALSALRFYRCNELLSLPGDWAGKWFVVPQVAPRTMMFGLQSDTIHPEKMQVVQVGSRYALAEGTKVILPMGGSVEQAAQLLEVMQKNHVDRVTRVGPAGEAGVAFLLRSR
jgi:hypothetical protein